MQALSARPFFTSVAELSKGHCVTQQITCPTLLGSQCCIERSPLGVRQERERAPCFQAHPCVPRHALSKWQPCNITSNHALCEGHVTDAQYSVASQHMSWPILGGINLRNWQVRGQHVAWCVEADAAAQPFRSSWQAS